MKLIDVKIKLVREGAQIPVYKHDDDACGDCYASIKNYMEDAITIAPYSRKLIPLGIALGIPVGWEVVLRPRSGNTSKSIDIGIGTIDAGYRGEICACVINNSDKPYTVHDGDRICQMALREAPKANFIVVDSLDETERGEGGFGSTGR